MADLKTDYKDDVLDTEVNELRKYQMIQNEDGTVSFVDVTEYLQVGDSFGSADVNAITERLTDGVFDTLEEVEANTQENMIGGALALKELKSKYDIRILNSVNVLEVKDKGVYFVTSASGLPSILSSSASGNTGYLFVDSLIYNESERRTIKWIPFASNYAWYNTYYDTWTGWISDFMGSVASSSELTFPSGVSMYHHLQISVQNDIIRISMGIQTTSEIQAYGIVLTIPEGKRGWRDTAVVIVAQTGATVRPAWYSHTNGTITMLGASLPAGNYFIIGS